MKKSIAYIFLLAFMLISLQSCGVFNNIKKKSKYGYSRPPKGPNKPRFVKKKPSTKSSSKKQAAKKTPPKPKVIVRSYEERGKQTRPHPKIEKDIIYDSYVDSTVKYTLLRGWEDQFYATGLVHSKRQFNLRPFSVPIPNDPHTQLNAITCKPANGYAGYYEKEKVNKDCIVLHFTVGNIKSDIDILTRPRKGYTKWRCSVPFVLGRTGHIYQLFGSSYWSHHLGSGSIGGNEYTSKKSIGIEISNYGPLIKVGNQLETVYSRPKKDPSYTDVYCSIYDTDQYIELDQPYRGYKYFAKFTDEQYESLIVLLRYLTAKHNIPRNFISEQNRYKANSSNARFKGIVSHVNFRATGKWDIGPAFDWDRVIRGVQASNRDFLTGEW